jgi:hypothetical protein
MHHDLGKMAVSRRFSLPPTSESVEFLFPSRLSFYTLALKYAKESRINRITHPSIV